MTAMSIETPAGLPMPSHRDWTVTDLEGLPDDGRRYELLDGMLLVTPAPVLAHQRVLGNLYIALRAACDTSMEVFMAPVDWQPDRGTSFQPDLLVVRKEDRGVKNITAPLVLAVEVLSPSTRRKDLLLKRSKYEDAGVASYWVVDPDKPSFTAFDLVDGHYRVSVEVTGDEPAQLRLPFPLTLTPSALNLD
jgi:Uma2 family endonuclease